MPDNAQPNKRPNLLFIFAGQWRRQALGCMDADPVWTPYMDRVAAEGMVFENALSCNPLCTPNRAAMLTGRHPFSLNMMYNWLRLPVGEETIAKALAPAGYDTGYVGKWHLDEWDGDERHGTSWNALTPAGERRMGFDFWHASGCVHNHWKLDYITTDNRRVQGEGWQIDHETDIALRYLRNAEAQRDLDRPFCLFVSFSPPHTQHGPIPHRPSLEGYNYAAPERYEGIYAAQKLPVPPNASADWYLPHAPGYFGAVTSMDDAVGRLMATLEDTGMAEDTVVVVTSDHGDCLGSHRKLIKDVWYEESIGIPFVVRWPGHVPAGRRESMLLNTPDMMPTLLGLMGVEIPPGRHGRDFSPVLLGRGGEVEPREQAFLSFNGGSPPRHLVRWDGFPDEGNRKWRGVRTRRYTYVAASREQYGNPERFCQPLPEGVTQVVFDLENDPWQVNPIYPGQGCDGVIANLHARLAGWLAELGDPFLETQWK